jgi:cell division protein ZapE
MDLAWGRVTPGKQTATAEIGSRAATLSVPEAGAGAARFSASAGLCETPLGANPTTRRFPARYHTVFVDRVPVMGPSEAQRCEAFHHAD